jgi:transposase-like protein
MGRDRFDRKVDLTFDAKPDTLERIEVITGACRRRSWPLDVKARIVMESLEDGAVMFARSSCSPGASRFAIICHRPASRQW